MYFTKLIKAAHPYLTKTPFVSRMVLYCVPDIHWHVSVKQVGKMRIRLRRNRSFWIRDPLTHESYPLAILTRLISKGDIVWDIGANIGLYSRWILKNTDAGKVVAFEPMADNRLELIYNLELGGIADKVVVMPFALGRENGEVEFQVDNIQSASGTINDVTDGKACVAREQLKLPPIVTKVQCRTIDSLVLGNAAPKPDVLKIDVEGAERMLLEGGREFFANGSPKLLIETHGLQVSKECIEFFLDLGYFLGARVRKERSSSMHMRIDRNYLSSMTDQYDAHFIVASKNPSDIPESLVTATS